MTLDEFVSEQEQLLQRFRSHWITQQGLERQKGVPAEEQVWPDDMASGDWDEQLQIFEE